MVENDPSLAFEIAGLSIHTRLNQAIERGQVIRDADGKLSLASVHKSDSYIGKFDQFQLQCVFLNRFLFQQIYAESTVPFGCRDCYKVKIVTTTLRQLMAAKEIAESSGHNTKSGAEVDNRRNQDLYGTYLYFQSLDQARKAFQTIRGTIDRHPELGPGIEIRIKRGCTNYEQICGPSDQYKFDPRLELAEAYLFRRFVENKPANEPVLTKEQKREKKHAKWLLKMIAAAYRIGDDTYKDFTNGKPIFSPLVNYSSNNEPTL
jgi:hypothetical protein